MMPIVKTVIDKPYRKWYKRNVDPDEMGNLVEYFQKKGYILDSSGFMLRSEYPKKINPKTNQTTLDIIFTRPTDLHYHRDVSEFVTVLSGKAELERHQFQGIEKYANPDFSKYDMSEPELDIIEKRDWFISPPGEFHGYKPIRTKSDMPPYLEIALICTGILNPEKEVCVERFDRRKSHL